MYSKTYVDRKSDFGDKLAVPKMNKIGLKKKQTNKLVN